MSEVRARRYGNLYDGIGNRKGGGGVKAKRLISRGDRAVARRMRDNQWAFMEKVYRLGKVWFCPWNKDHHLDETTLPENYEVHGLMTGMELCEWLRSHRDWWIIGRWREKKYARSVRLTEAGRRAYREREKYDMELVTGGQVEPGWTAMPLRRKSLNRRSLAPNSEPLVPEV